MSYNCKSAPLKVQANYFVIYVVCVLMLVTVTHAWYGVIQLCVDSKHNFYFYCSLLPHSINMWWSKDGYESVNNGVFVQTSCNTRAQARAD